MFIFLKRLARGYTGMVNLNLSPDGEVSYRQLLNRILMEVLRWGI
jgi:hypothetical protein